VSHKQRTKRYYYPEHESAYRRIEREGKTGWNEIHGGSGFESFSSRDHLERALGMLQLDPAHTEVLEYGCGTGPGACFLAARGFRVDAIDLIPRAIKLARRFAAERGLKIHFAVQDICALADVPPRKRYDLVVDFVVPSNVKTGRVRVGICEGRGAGLVPAECGEAVGTRAMTAKTTQTPNTTAGNDPSQVGHALENGGRPIQPPSNGRGSRRKTRGVGAPSIGEAGGEGRFEAVSWWS
jgi:SAM-dependent methyltransferase